MSKHTKIEDEIKRLRTLSPDTLSAYTVRLPPTLALEAAHFARDNNYQMARGLLAIFESYLRATQAGVALEFGGDTQRQLDLIATAYGVSRGEVVARMVSENLVHYLQRAVVLEGERRQVERTLQVIRDDAETPAATRQAAEIEEVTLVYWWSVCGASGGRPIRRRRPLSLSADGRSPATAEERDSSKSLTPPLTFTPAA